MSETTQELFREDGYLRTCEATVTHIDSSGVCLDRTVFYPLGGGQPGDSGRLIRANGDAITVTDTRRVHDSGHHLHALEPGAVPLTVGEPVRAEIDWPRRHRFMRLHSCLHLLCAVIPAPVTGGSIREDSARLDFDLPEPPDKQAIEDALNRLIDADHPMSIQWITDQQMQQQPELIRTMSVQPPMGRGRVRLVRFGTADLQPCGGTHVAASGEIGPMTIQSIKKKGKQNRRITVVFAADGVD